MLIKKITLDNVRSYKHEEVVFPDGSTLLSGDIGSGKTSILLGIEFALFGLQPGQRGNSILKNGETEGKVKLDFEVDGKQISIERTLKKKKTISQDYCSIIIDSEKKEMSVTELKNLVLDLLNYPMEFSKKQNLLYKFTVYTPQEEMKQIIIQDAETRINTLRHVFGIDKYKKILENVSVVAAKLREEKRMNEGMTANLEQDKLNLIEKEEELTEKKTNLVIIEEELSKKINHRKLISDEKEKIAVKIVEKNKLQQEIEKTKIVIANKKDTISSNVRTIEQIKNQIQELKNMNFDESQILQSEENISLKKKESEKISGNILEINSRINSFSLKIDDNRKLEKKLSNLEICPTCLQNVEAIHRANVLNKIQNDISYSTAQIKELEKEKIILTERTQKLNTEISLQEKELTDLKILRIKFNEIQEKQKHLAEIEKTNQMLSDDILLLSQHNQTLEKSILELKGYESIFETKQKEFDEALKDERAAEIKSAELKKEIEFFAHRIEELKNLIQKTEQIKQRMNYITELENWLSKKFLPLISFIEKNVMLKLRAEFSHLFAEWFYTLVSDNFSVKLGDDFTPIIEQQDYEIDYAYLSGGERTAVALAYRLALNQVINSLLSKIKTRDLVILDEPTDGFSEQQLDKMREVLEQLNVKQLIIVSHEQKIEGFVENVIRFKKEKGISKKT